VRRLVLSTALAVLATAAPAAAAPPAPVPLERGWTFTPAGGDERRVTVPHVFDGRPLTRLFEGTTGTYRLRFTAPRLPSGQGWGLLFEQVRREARITINGRPAGVHRDPYVPFAIPAGAVRPGQRNELVIEVDNRKGPEPREGWWNWGGITRPVSLVPEGPIVLRDVGVLPQLDCDDEGRCRNARVRLDGWLTNRSSGRTRPTVSLRMRAPRSGAVTRAEIDGPLLEPGQTERLRATVHVRGRPELWSPRHPARYHTTVSTRHGDGRVAQVDRLRTGLRSVAVRDGHLRLNGRRIELRGASIQEDVRGRGPALTEADMDRIVADLEAVNANVTRAHYLLNDGLLDRLDAAGILVWTQAPIYHRDVLLRTPRQRANALSTLRSTVLAARNHPSTLVYSTANELNAMPSELPPTQRYLLDAARLVRETDPTVPVAVDVLAYPSLPFDPTYRAYDALGINSYFGWYPGKPERPTGDVEDMGPYLQRWKDRYRDQALVLTEFGAEATKDGPAHEKQTYAFQAEYLEGMLDAVRRSPADGAIYWTLHEFAVKPFWDGLTNAEPRPGVAVDAIHNKALISYAGKRKPAWVVAARDFAATPLFPGLREAPRATVPPPGSDVPGAVLAALALLALLALAAFHLRAFRAVRATPPETAVVVPLRRELDRDDVAVGHDVVAAFEA
jgi:beta-galactosidase/beta-glucuronidase